MGFLIWGIVVLALGIAALVYGFRLKYTTEESTGTRDRYGMAMKETVEHKGSRLVKWIASGVILLGVIFLGASFVFQTKIGEVSFILNPGGGLSRVDDTAGFGLKSPLQSTQTWDLFSRDVRYTGGDPSYTDGEIQGPLIKAGVKGGTVATFAMTGTYDIRQADFAELYTQFRTQDRFTRQVIEPQILKTAKSVPSDYTAVEFRGGGVVGISDGILTSANERLEDYGVVFSVVTVGDPDFPDNVETAIAQVEESQQKEAKAQAELRAAEVSAQTQVVEAEAKAKANDLLDRSLTPEVLESIRLETMRPIGEHGNMVVDLDSGANILLSPQAK